LLGFAQPKSQNFVFAKLHNPPSHFLPFIFQSEAFITHATNRRIGSTNPHVRWRDIADFEFLLPPLDQQRRIAELLWAVDEVTRCLTEMIDESARALLAERDGFFSAHSKGKTKRVDELFEVQLGKMLSPKARTGESPLPYLGNKNVQWGRFDLTEVLEMDFSEEEFEKFHLKVGDLLVCEGGEVGRSAIWNGSISDCCFQKALHRLRPLRGEIFPEYMLEFMFWANSKGLFSSLTGHSTIAHLPAIKLKSLGVPCVDVDEQRDFLAKVDAYRTAIQSITAKCEGTKTLQNALLSVLN
jgi:type I restriction enzyme, S subunit